MDIQTLLVVTIGAILINNFVLSKFLGICPFIGISKDTDSAIGMGMAVIFVMTVASMVTYSLYHFVLIPLKLDFLRTLSFIVVIATLVQVVEIVIRKVSPHLYESLGIFLPLITTNCAVLGVAILNIDKNYNFIYSAIYGFSSGIGFTLALFLMAGIRERLELADLPKALEGIPITFITASLMAMAFLGFSGLIVG